MGERRDRRSSALKVGLIVDGPGDFAALKCRLGNAFKVLKTDGPRGHTVSVEQLVSRSRKQISILRTFRCTHVVLVTDFEARHDDYGVFRQRLATALGALDATVTITCAVPNRMMENWYLADIAYLATQRVFLKPNIAQKRYEGTMGKDELKKLFLPRYTYNEVEHGAQLFSMIRFPEARQYSESLSHFLDVLAACGVAELT